MNPQNVLEYGILNNENSKTPLNRMVFFNHFSGDQQIGGGKQKKVFNHSEPEQV